jgi:hypothetical protein
MRFLKKYGYDIKQSVKVPTPIWAIIQNATNGQATVSAMSIFSDAVKNCTNQDIEKVMEVAEQTLKDKGDCKMVLKGQNSMLFVSSDGKFVQVGSSHS